MADPIDSILEGTIIEKFVNELAEAFRDAAPLRTWFEVHFPSELPADVLTGATIHQQCWALLKWAEMEGEVSKLLQNLADDPPNHRLPDVIAWVSSGKIRPGCVSDDPRVAPALDGWFVSSRPFVNRQNLRDHLKSLKTAAPGADSVLLINGAKSTGKTHSTRLAAHCAPTGSPPSIDIAEWGEASLMNAADLARAIDGYTEREIDDFPHFDETKEHDAVPRILNWLISKLHNRQAWIIVDHCDRLSLTTAAHDLLIRLAQRVEQGSLPHVRLIMADIDRAALPGPLAWNSRFDVASLPDKQHVQAWCKTLAVYAKRLCPPELLDDLLNAIFPEDAASNTPEVFERRIFDAYRKIMAAEAVTT